MTPAHLFCPPNETAARAAPPQLHRRETLLGERGKEAARSSQTRGSVRGTWLLGPKYRNYEVSSGKFLTSLVPVCFTCESEGAGASQVCGVLTARPSSYYYYY